MRLIFSIAMVLFSLAIPGLAQDGPAPWQATVTGQIEAFRDEDGATALAFAAAGFRTQFEGQPEAFYVAIVASGYEPIVTSRSHSFGEFTRVNDTTVMQVVKLIGADQGLYEALYRLMDEPGEGWRVEGVALRREAGVGV